MMNLPFQLCESNDLIIPKGPSFEAARTIVTKIDGTRIKFRAPKHKPRRASYEPTMPSTSYSSKDVNYRIDRGDKINVPYDWAHFRLFEHSWIFNGPWFSGTRAHLDMYVDLAKPVNYPNQGMSLFHPRAFEQFVGDYLTYHFAGGISENSEGKCYRIAPVDWQPFTSVPVIAAKFKVVSDQSVITWTPKHNLVFPISNELMVVISFEPNQLVNISPQEERDKRVSASTMIELIEDIISSLEIELSPEAKVQQEAATKDLEDTSLISDYPPLDWNSDKFRGANIKSIGQS